MNDEKRFQAAHDEAVRLANAMRSGEVRYIPATFVVDGQYIPSGYHLRRVGLAHTELSDRWRKA